MTAPGDDPNADAIVTAIEAMADGVELLLVMASSAVPGTILRRLAREWRRASNMDPSPVANAAFLRCARELEEECDAIAAAAAKVSIHNFAKR